MLTLDTRPPLRASLDAHWAADMGAVWRDVDGRLVAVCAACTLDRPVAAPLALYGGRWYCPDELPARVRWSLTLALTFVLVSDDPSTIGAYAAAAAAVPAIIVSDPSDGRYACRLAVAVAVTIGPAALPGYAAAHIGARPRVYALRVDGSAMPDRLTLARASVARVFRLPEAADAFGRVVGRLADVAAGGRAS